MYKNNDCLMNKIKKQLSDGELDMHVMGFTSRPVLQVKRKAGGGPVRPHLCGRDREVWRKG